MKKKLLFIIFVLFFGTITSHGQIVAWHFYGKTGNETVAAPTLANNLLIVTDLVRNGSLTASAFANSFGSSNFPVSENKTNALANDRGLSFTVTPKPGYKFSLSSLEFKFIRDASGPNAFAWYYSVDGTTFSQIGSDISYTGDISMGSDALGVIQTPLDLSAIPVLQSVVPGTIVTFKLICWGSTNTTGRFAIGSSQLINVMGTDIEEKVLQLFGVVNPYCPPPDTPGAGITGTTPACGNTTLTYTGSAPLGIDNYWQTTSNGTSTVYNAASSLTVNTSGDYYVRARNASGCWSAAYGPYTVVINSTPTISSQPTTVYIADTGNTSFAITATNGTTYQWQVDTGSGTFTDIPSGGIYGTSSTTATLTITGASTGMNGYKYRCVVKADPCASVTSNSATLNVGTLCLNEEFYAGTTVPSGWVFTGIAGTYTNNGNYGLNSPSLKMSDGDNVTTSTLVNPMQLSFWFEGKGTNSSSSFLVEGFNGSSWVTIENITNSIPTTGTVKTYNANTIPVLPNNLQKFRFTFKKGGNGENLAFDDVAVLCTSTACTPPSTPGSSITGITPACGSTILTYNGTATAPVINYWQTAVAGTSTTSNAASTLNVTTSGDYYVRALNTTTSCWSVFSLGPYTVTVNSAATLVLSSGSAAQTVCSGSPIANIVYTFGGGATGATVTGLPAGLTFSVSGNTLTISGAPTAIGTYTVSTTGQVSPCTAVNLGGTITVDPVPIVTGQPSNSVVTQGDSAIFAISTTGTVTGYQWQENTGSGYVDLTNTGPYSNVNTASMTITGVSLAMDGYLYRCVVFGVSSCSVNSNSALLFVNQAKYYRSKVSGDWDMAGTWESSTDNISWSNAATAPTFSDNSITVLSGHTVAISSNVSVDQVIVNGDLIVSGSSVLVNLKTGTGTDIVVNNGGILTMASGVSGGWDIDSGAAISLLSGATYVHNSVSDDSGFLNAVSLDTNSTFIYRGSSTLTPAVSLANRNFGHLRFESTSGALNIVATNNSSTCSSNDFYIGSNVTLNSVNLTTNSSFAVLGNFTNDGIMDNTSGYFNFTFSGTSKTISGGVIPNFDNVNITGSYTMNTSISIPRASSEVNVSVGAVLDSGGENQIIGNGVVNVNGKFITRDAQGFTGVSATIPTINPSMGNGSVIEYGGGNQILTPASYSNLTISGTGTKIITSSSEILVGNELSVTSSVLQIDNNKLLTVTNAIKNTSGNDIIVLNGGNLVQITEVDNATSNTNIGNIKMTRTSRALKQYDYIYWGSPVKENVVSQIPSIFDKSYVWDLNGSVDGTWNTTTSIVPAKGFITRLSTATSGTDFNFTGTPNNGIVKTYGNSFDNGVTTDATGNTILLGNPYPCAIDASAFVTDPANFGKIGGTLYFWTAITPITDNSYTVNDYATWNGTGSTAASDNSGTDNLKPTGKIASGQGFFAVLLNDYDVTFKNSIRVRVSSDNNQFFKINQNSLSANQEQNRIWLNLKSNEAKLRQMLVGYVSGATNDYDNLYDGHTFTTNQADIYSIYNDQSFVIQGRGLPFVDSDKVPLGYRVDYSGDYSIEIDQVDGLFANDQTIYLEDKLSNIIHDLKSSPYKFRTNSGVFNDRFVLRYTTETLGTPDMDSVKNNVMVVSNHRNLIVSSTGENIKDIFVYDLLGRQIYVAKDIGSKNFKTSDIFSSQQVLIIKIRLENGVVVSRKTIIEDK